MAYKDKEKQKQANKEASQRSRDKVKGMTLNDIGGSGIAMENVIPEQDVTPEQGKLLEEVFGKALLETGLPDDKPRATDLGVQAIWDGRNAQGQAGGYSDNATPEDYPQIQKPYRS